MPSKATNAVTIWRFISKSRL